MSDDRDPFQDIGRAVAGLRTQLERISKFESSIDIEGSMDTYRRLLTLLTPRMEELRRAAGLPASPPVFASLTAFREVKSDAELPGPVGRVFTYWNRPLETAPPLVRACVAQLRRVYPDAHVLDGPSVREWTDIPSRIADVLEDKRPAHFSDYIRTRILETHGGVWVDATTWVGRSIDAELPRFLSGGTVFPRWTRASIANWFIASHPGTALIRMLRLVLDLWWEENDDLPDYFLYHRIFEILTLLVPEVRGQWEATPTVSALSAHRMQLRMMQPWDPAALERILMAMPLQKLSYKYDEVPAGSMLERLLLRSEPLNRPG